MEALIERHDLDCNHFFFAHACNSLSNDLRFFMTNVANVWGAIRNRMQISHFGTQSSRFKIKIKKATTTAFLAHAARQSKRAYLGVDHGSRRNQANV